MAEKYYFVREFSPNKENKPTTEIHYEVEEVFKKLDEAKEKDLKISVYEATCILDWS
ncbi:hypothetical protein M0P65_05885 [Candidatus Gracilibacteria bacterium]|jgi:hypothetical protein|nr:hypothetical protein [Candidatus Gracilibacteria bacterium]